MNKSFWTLLIIIPMSLSFIGATGLVFGGDDLHEVRGLWGQNRIDVKLVENDFYREECGSCHFPYQPGLLPARLWKQLMTQLENHFNESAELDALDIRKITSYLTDNAADRSDYNLSRGINSSLRDHEIPLRMSTLRYFKRIHHELPTSMVVNNPKVRSFIESL